MRRIPIIYYALLFCLLNPLMLTGQKAIVVSGNGLFYELDLTNGNCQTKQINPFCNLNLPGFSVAQYKNKVYYNSGGSLYETDLANPALCRSMGVLVSANSMTADKNGTLYWVNGNELMRLPAGWAQPEYLGTLPYLSAGDLMFYGDKLFLAAAPSGGTNNFSLVEVNISSPANSKVYMETPGYDFYGLINIAEDCNTNKVYAITTSTSGPGSDIIEINMEAKTIMGKVCSIDVNVYDAASITETGEVRGVNINDLTVKPQCENTGLGEISVAATSATNGVQLSFSFNGNPATATGVFSNIPAGNYPIKITSSDGCYKDTFAIVPFIEKLEVSTLPKPDTCGALKGSVTINGISHHTGFRYSVENAAFVAGNEFTGLSAGRKSLKVIETNGCTLDTSFVIGTYQPLMPVTGYVIKEANCTNADGSIEIQYQAGAGILGARINGGIVQTSNIFPGLTAGDHQLQIITATCVFDTTITIPLLSTPPPVINFTVKPEDCAGRNNATMQIHLTGSEAPYAYSFNNSDYSNHTFYTQLAAGTFPVSVKDGKGCIFSGTVTVPPYAVLPVTVQATVVPTDCWQLEGGKVTLQVNGTEAPYFIRIDHRNFLAGQEIKGLAPGTFMAQIRNGNNCLIDSVQVVITEQNIPGISCDTVYVPSAFTPNGDGKNDLLKPFASNQVTGFVFKVYNRAGQVVFETRELKKGWNGQYMGREMPQGTYVWTYTYIGNGGRSRTFKGTTVLIR